MTAGHDQGQKTISHSQKGGHSQNLWSNVPGAPKEHKIYWESSGRPIKCRFLGVIRFMRI